MVVASAGTMEDGHIKILVEFFFPNLYETAAKCEDDYRYRKHGRPSETNYRWTSNLVMLVLFWLQDAVILLGRFGDELACLPPWVNMLHDDAAYAQFHALGQQITAVMQASNFQAEARLLAQNELLQAVHNASVQTANMLRVELNEYRALMGRLPTAVAQAFGAMYHVMREENKQETVVAVEGAFRDVVRRMLSYSYETEHEREARRERENAEAEYYAEECMRRGTPRSGNRVRSRVEASSSSPGHWSHGAELPEGPDHSGPTRADTPPTPPRVNTPLASPSSPSSHLPDLSGSRAASDTASAPAHQQHDGCTSSAGRGGDVQPREIAAAAAPLPDGQEVLGAFVRAASTTTESVAGAVRTGTGTRRKLRA